MNCKPADLALITKSPNARDQIGKVVEVLSAYGSTEYGFAWWCKSRTPIPVVAGGMQNVVVIPDEWLRPVSGIQIADETPIETNAPEALRLALGIESRSYA